MSAQGERPPPGQIPTFLAGYRAGDLPTCREVCDALWLAARQHAAARRSDTGEPAPRPADERRRPPAGPAAPSPGHPGTEPRPGPRRAGDAPHAPPGDIGPGDRAVVPRPGVAAPPPARRVPGPRATAPPPIEIGRPGSEEVPQFRHERAFMKALRPLKRLVDTHHGPVELDEEATAERAVQDELWLPVCRPATERWLDLDIVIDDSDFSHMHRRQFLEFCRTLRAVGAFRLVRTHLLDSDRPRPLLAGAAAHGPARAPESLVNAGDPGRRLVIVLSDGVGEAWHAGVVQRALVRWGERCPLVIINPLPARQWHRTGITVEAAALRAPAPGAANRAYRPGPGRYAEGVPVPVIELDAGQLARWAGLVTASAEWWGAVMYCRRGDGPAAHRPPPRPRPQARRSAAELVRRFRAAATPEAFRLAVCLATVPLSLPVMRRVQAAMLPASRPADLTEVVASGLLRRLDGFPAAVRDPRSTAVAFDFLPGVRGELLAAGRRSETARAILTAIDCLSDRIDGLRGLRDVLLFPHRSTPPAMPPKARPYFEPICSGLHSLGEPYRRPVRALLGRLEASVSPPATWGSRLTATSGRAAEGEPMPSPNQVEVSLPGEHLPVPSRQTNRYPGVSVSIRAVPPADERSPNEPPPVWGNVPPRNVHFTGREELLAELHERLSSGTTAVLPHALHGMGGVGKSQLAIEYVYRHTADYDLIWWVSAESPTQVRQSIAELAAELGLPVGNEVNVAVPAALEALRVGRPYRNWLLIFDNAENVHGIREFFPGSGLGKVLITSRNSGWADVAHTVEVNVFERRESIELLRIRHPHLSEEAANELAEALGDLPLAIEQAAAWLAETGMQVDEYLSLLQEKMTELLRSNTPVDYDRPVAAAWNVSLERLHKSNAPALRLLQLCAFFAPEPIARRLLTGARDIEGPPELLETLADPIKLSRALRAINQYALARISHRHNTILLHRLVQRVLRDQLTEQEQAQFRHCIHVLLANADPREPHSPENWPLYSSLLPHVLSSGALECDDPWVRLLILHIVDYLFRRGDREGCLELCQQVFHAWRDKLGEEHEDTLTAELKLARALRGVGEGEAAFDHDRHARDVLVATVGEEHERTLEAQGFVCIDMRIQGDFAGALDLDRRLYETARRRFGPDDPITLRQAFLYGLSLRLNGRPREAEELDRDTYQRQSRVLGEEHILTLNTLAAIALDQMEAGRYLESREFIRQLTRRMRAKYGDDHPGTIGNLTTLSVAERKSGEHRLALELSEEALRRSRARYGDESPDTLRTAVNHAINLRQTGDLAESAAQCALLVERYQKVYGADHPNTALAKVNLAVPLRLLGQVTESRALNEEALDLLRRRLGPDHPRSIIAAINLASDMAALGDIESARDLGTQTLEKARAVAGEDHPTTLACALNLALDLRKLGDVDQAERLFADTLSRYRRVLGDSHPATMAAAQSIRADCDMCPSPL